MMTNILLYLLLACTGPADAHLAIDLTPEYDDSYAGVLVTISASASIALS